MELRHLRYVLAIADTLHFGEAARRLGISQPPLSMQVRQLEEELGIKLFDRSRHHVTVTDAGRMFVEEARLILAHAKHASMLASRVNQGEVWKLTLGVAGPADADVFVNILRRFSARHPQIRMAVRNMSTAEQVEAILARRLHAGFVAQPVNDPGLATVTVWRQPIVVALPPGHPMCKRARVPLRSLASESHIMFARELSPPLYDAIVHACARVGFALNVAHEVDNLYTACALVAAGLGVCFVPAGIQDWRSRRIVLRPLAPELSNVDSHLALAFLRDANCELLQLFVDVVKEVVATTRRKPPTRSPYHSSSRSALRSPEASKPVRP